MLVGYGLLAGILSYLNILKVRVSFEMRSTFARPPESLFW